ncbi:MAG: peptidoglycan-binding domain-containing protein [Candidatus Obscuribacter sp.]|nr:peptidoglycan-binding domain-containing protein [Candidatus Obscuribacter sp.]MBK9621373.1 peptidoglycan-binding domain-containing protein [Candidatus Obscuribacter sp.]
MLPSGKSWVSQFPTSKSVDDLISPFRENLQAFLSALAKAGASVTINATYRPVERAYLMHYAFRIAREGLSPLDVPAMDGVDIQWNHLDSAGKLDIVASRRAAQDMVAAYGIAFKPALRSNHTARLAVDMSIGWSGSLSIVNASGKKVVITSSPRSGSNTDLIRVGKTYGVIKLVSDPPHWSQNGRFRVKH